MPSPTFYTNATIKLVFIYLFKIDMTQLRIESNPIPRNRRI